MKKTLKQLDLQLDEIDQWIMETYPEEMHEELHYAIAKKVELEIERSKMISG